MDEGPIATTLLKMSTFYVASVILLVLIVYISESSTTLKVSI